MVSAPIASWNRVLARPGVLGAQGDDDLVRRLDGDQLARDGQPHRGALERRGEACGNPDIEVINAVFEGDGTGASGEPCVRPLCKSGRRTIPCLTATY